jgi:hypothetical protein
LLAILLDLYIEYLTNEAVERFGDFRIGGQVSRSVTYCAVLLQGMIDGLKLEDAVEWKLMRKTLKY